MVTPAIVRVLYFLGLLGVGRAGGGSAVAAPVPSGLHGPDLRHHRRTHLQRTAHRAVPHPRQPRQDGCNHRLRLAGPCARAEPERQRCEGRGRPAQGRRFLAKVEKAGLKVAEVAEAVKAADVVMILLPDEQIANVYKNDVARTSRKALRWSSRTASTCTMASCSRAPTPTCGVVAPKAPGHTVRSTYTQGGGVPTSWPVHQDKTGKARDLALSYATANGGGKAASSRPTSAKNRDRPAGFETLVEAGYAPEMAYFECLHELKLIVDLMYEGGIANMNYSISNNAEYGEYVTGPRIVTEETKKAMKQVLKDIQTGEYAKSFVLENAAGAPTLISRRRLNAEHQIEVVGEKLRAMMPWIKKNKLVDQTRN
ncbi:acetohydroxy acid isomeroreductase, catalytic domain-containing protein [Ditylenchus destructor]|uniref:Acetohydroxy-acid reductoisomerase n=1 Tax=Ditylenchus destructor TaxID=166010 RepID=A0AAD4QUP7_9BILA|nr:acetohydroxy acid isomeroreductase, catalytic domain-containing protein [Ditylenchus destructor]